MSSVLVMNNEKDFIAIFSGLIELYSTNLLLET